MDVLFSDSWVPEAVVFLFLDPQTCAGVNGLRYLTMTSQKTQIFNLNEDTANKIYLSCATRYLQTHFKKQYIVFFGPLPALYYYI